MIDIKNLGGCVIVTTSQTIGTVLQSRGCDSREAPDLAGSDRIADETWEVQAEGEAGFVQAVQPFRFEGGVEADRAPALNDETRSLLGIAPGTAANGAAEGDEFVAANTIGVYDWQGESVTVWADLDQDFCCVVYEAESDTFSGGSTGTACRDWFVAVHSDGNRGFVVVVVRGARTATIRVNDEEARIAPAPTRVDGLRAAIVDAPFDFSTGSDHLGRVQVLEPDGTPSPCIQQ